MKKRRASKVQTGEYAQAGKSSETTGASSVPSGADIASAVFADSTFSTSVSSGKSPSSSSKTSSSKASGSNEHFTDVPKYKTDGFDGKVPEDIESREDELARYESMQQFLAAEGDYSALPHPDEFNAYPIEVQRKIMEWTDRDVKARRDDESRRQDELMRAQVERDRRRQIIPAILVVVALVCGSVTGVLTQNPVFSIAFLVVPLAVIAALLAGADKDKRQGDKDRNKPPRM